MSTNPLQQLLERKRVILADGATGTHLGLLVNAAHLTPPAAQELLNEQRPDLVRQHYRAYIEAGSDVVLTNTWAANHYALDAVGVQLTTKQIRDLNRMGVQLLKEEIAVSARPMVAAGSVGPTGWTVIDPEDTGHPIIGHEISYSAAVSAFTEQIAGLVEGGVDVIWIETQIGRHEVNAAIDGCKMVGGSLGSDVPFVVSMVFNKYERTQEEYDLQHFAQDFGRPNDRSRRPSAFGFNCGYGPEVALELIARNGEFWRGAEPLLAKANCGSPRRVDGRFEPSGLTPKQMGRYAQLAADYGVRIVGACCGSLPEHIAAMREALDDYSPSPPLPAPRIHDEIERAH